MANSPIRSKQSLNCTPLVTRSATAKSNLYKDLDYLEESVDAEFQQYVADTLASTSQDPQLNKSARSDTSVRHDSDILRALEHVPMVSKARPPVGSSCRESSISNRNVVRSSSSRSGSDEEEIDDDDDEQLLPERVVSPGQYFGARSLPLESFNELWADRHQPSPSSQQQQQQKEKRRTSRKDLTNDPLWQTFKALPLRLSHHDHDISMDFIHSLSQPRHADTKSSHENSKRKDAPVPASSDENSSSAATRRQNRKSAQELQLYSVEPKHVELKPDKISGKATATFSVRNHSIEHPCSYSLFSAKGRLKFVDAEQGTIQPGGSADIVIQLRNIPIREAAVDTALVLLDGKHAEQVNVSLPHQFRSNEADCPVCALERKCLSV